MYWMYSLSIHTFFGAFCIGFAVCQPGPSFSEKPCLKATRWTVLAQGIWRSVLASAQDTTAANVRQHTPHRHTPEIRIKEKQKNTKGCLSETFLVGNQLCQTLHTAEQTLQNTCQPLEWVAATAGVWWPRVPHNNGSEPGHQEHSSLNSAASHIPNGLLHDSPS